MFPVNISSTKPVQQVDFNKILPRDNKMYQRVKLSESLYSAEQHLNLTKKKEVGILQFGKIGDKRGDYEKRMAKMKEFKNLRDDELHALLQNNEAEGIFKNEN